MRIKWTPSVKGFAPTSQADKLVIKRVFIAWKIVFKMRAWDARFLKLQYIYYIYIYVSFHILGSKLFDDWSVF